MYDYVTQLTTWVYNINNYALIHTLFMTILNQLKHYKHTTLLSATD